MEYLPNIVNKNVYGRKKSSTQLQHYFLSHGWRTSIVFLAKTNLQRDTEKHNLSNGH